MNKEIKFPDTPVYLGTLLSDITLNESNSTIKAAKLTQLFYFLKQEAHVVRRYSTAFSYAVEHYLLHVYKSDIISLSFSHYHSLQVNQSFVHMEGIFESINQMIELKDCLKFKLKLPFF